MLKATDLKIKDYIVIDTEVCHGKPCFKGTRIMVHLVMEMLAAGETMEDIKKAYPELTKEHIDAALLFAAKTTEIGERYVSFSK